IVTVFAAGTASAQINSGRTGPGTGASSGAASTTPHLKSPAPPPTGSKGDQPASLAGQVQLVLDKLEDDLRIGAHQQKAWDAYRERVVRYAEDLSRARYSARDMQDGGMTVPQQLDRLSEIANNRMTAVEDIIDASRALYETLGPDQKKLAEKSLVVVPIRLVS